MMNLTLPRRFACLLWLNLAVILSLQHIVHAQSCDQPVAKAASVQGTVEVQRVGETQWQAVQLNGQYCPGDTIRVGDKSRADLALANRSVARLNAGSTLTLKAMAEKRTSLLNLIKGAGHFFSRGPRNLAVETPYTVVGVRGTEFFVSVEASQTLLSVFEGQVLAANAAGELALSSGQSAVAELGKAPVLRLVARPRDAVSWALYYPPVIDAAATAAQVGAAWREVVQKSVEFYLQGDLKNAFDSLETVPDDVRDASVLTYRASLQLAVGQVEAAEADIAWALRLEPYNSQAAALQTIIAVVRNDKAKALSTAQAAVIAARNDATARIALSYAQQAELDLEGARASLEKAVELKPDNALAWARLAELRSSFGLLDAALEAARRAVDLEPRLSRTQTVLGFAFLTQVKTTEAKATFEKAIELDQADPLPRLGLGLAMIREGQLEEGSREIDIATSLDPNNALFHSYLGKTRFEQKLSPLDARQYEVAKQLDPQDPTPWFYDAIRKQTENRPVEALRDLQKAIELNDNRAVYRSRLLLDSDLAARSASLARIYNDLGFEKLALAEGWRSVNTDPSNFSAHRFLADSYSVLPRHEIARVSELLQSQLLQPINLTPIQPRQAESSLNVVSAGGAASASFNEFNPLFNRDRLALMVSGFLGENETWSGEAVVSGIYGRASFSVGYSHFETDGFRANNNQKEDLVNAFVQLELSNDTSIQGEYRYRDQERGDLTQNFFSDDVRPNRLDTSETHSFRAGLRHALSSHSILLGSVMFQHRDANFHTEGPLGPFFVETDQDLNNEKSVSAEAQHLFRSKHINLTSGIGYFNIDALTQNTRRTLFEGTPLPSMPLPDDDGDTQHLNLYVYAYLSWLKNAVFTIGASGDFFRSDNAGTADADQFNPKFGLIWHPVSGTTIRAAAFRTLKRTFITDQTLEPTQVAGFNQFFDDRNATDAWRYGLAIDQKLTRDVYAGLEMTIRDLSIPALDLTSNMQGEVEAEEYGGRGYLFWTPHDWLAFSAEYQYEHIERRAADIFIFTFLFDEITTHRVPLGLRLFHPSGWSASLKGTYFNQDGTFLRTLPTGSVFAPGKDDFWIFDAAIRYRLPKRYGFFSLGMTNVFNEKFNYQEIDLDNPLIQPERNLFVRLTLSLP